ncbi:DUF1826 domain-containing protein [Candidatus Nitrotoga sp. M5]|uniref:DUF1826 domain-containing protein n=1 Tax=Candidatus Nitrotoga sp. M5 TaxID=2890409 RepID=UPI001EF5520C|nr:DUF1826 domain-containing protein [Candidatus Nitrotoga sp. M5]CAH1387138.1 conserved hypothetical protein [Candidatus Nitrotoga sp. M5]
MSVAIQYRSPQLPAMEPSSELLWLTDIFEPETQVVMVKRNPDSVIDDYLAVAALQMGGGFRHVLKSGATVPHHLLPAHTGQEAFAADLNQLVEIYTDLLDCPSVGLRLEVMNRAMCPRFHVDHVGIRLLCTYRGPATEWLEDACADRSKLGPALPDVSDENSGVILNPAGIHRATPYAIVLLKGSQWQGNEGSGIIHRSPIVPSNKAPRVLLALDALW